MNAWILLLLLAIAVCWARLIRPGANRLEGRVLLVMPLPLLARLRMHALPALLTLALGVALVAAADMAWWLLALPLLSAVLLVTVPVHYPLTDVGIRLGRSAFRRWTEFAGVQRAPGGARLKPVAGFRGYHIWLSRSRGDDEFLQVLRMLIRSAYKGHAASVSFPGAPQPASPIASPGSQPQAVAALPGDAC